MSQEHNSSQVDLSQPHVAQEHNPNRRLNKQDYKTLTLAALGGALEFYDFIIFVFFNVRFFNLFLLDSR